MPVIRISEELYGTIGKLGYGHEKVEDILWRILKYTDITRLIEDLTKDRAISIEPPVKEYKGGKKILGKNKLDKLLIGIKLRHKFRDKFGDGRIVYATVKDGYILFEGEKYSSLSAAGSKAAGYLVNGWKFWEYYDEDAGGWRKVDEFRKSE
ncbi:MAG: hypothetical protein U9O96_01040 [Candidatus Thermoplasmatota archaeon]|nr:hypothetical protein [Candidatus Thermoplasmatota archaeon]